MLGNTNFSRGVTLAAIMLHVLMPQNEWKLMLFKTIKCHLSLDLVKRIHFKKGSLLLFMDWMQYIVWKKYIIVGRGEKLTDVKD